MRESGSSYRSSIQVPPLTGPLLAVGVLLAVLPPVPPQALSSKTSSDKNDTQSMSILDWGLLCIMSSSENKLTSRIRLTLWRVNRNRSTNLLSSDRTEVNVRQPRTIDEVVVC